MPEIKIIIDKCKGCMLCIEACPLDLIKLSGKFNKKGYEVPEFIDNGKCTGCTYCALSCPDTIIEIYK